MRNINVKSKRTVVLRIAVVRSYMYKYAVVHTSNKDESFNAQANAKHKQQQHGERARLRSMQEKSSKPP